MSSYLVYAPRARIDDRTTRECRLTGCATATGAGEAPSSGRQRPPRRRSTSRAAPAPAARGRGEPVGLPPAPLDVLAELLVGLLAVAFRLLGCLGAHRGE